MSSPTRADLKLTFDDGGVIDAWTSATLTDRFTDPLGSVQVSVGCATSAQYADYRTKLAKGNQIHVYINGAHQGRFLIQDVDRETSADAGRVIKVTAHTPLITPYEGAVNPDYAIAHAVDTSVEFVLLDILGPYGFSKITTDARAHVNALTGVPLPGGAGPPYAVGDIKMRNAVAHDGETAYQFVARIITRLGVCLRILQDDTLFVGAPNYTQDPIATVVSTSTPGTYANADRFEGLVKIHETNAGQFAQVGVIGMRHLSAGDPDVARPSAVVNCTDVLAALGTGPVIPARCQYSSTVAPFKPLSYKDKSSRDPQQATNAALFELGMRGKDAYTVEGTVDGWISRTGCVWTVDTIVRVVVEAEGLDDPMYLLERTLHMDAEKGQRTSLKFIPKNALVIGVPPNTKGY
jgi:hypothetical protein